MVARFAPADRARLDRLVALHPYLEDLLWSFPGLAYALACGFYDAALCERVQAMICAGTALQHAARELGLPFWLRRLPPEAFNGKIPELPCDPGFGLKVCNHLPHAQVEARRWLDCLSLSYRICDGDFALWVARNWSAFCPCDPRSAVAVLGLLAWHAERPHAGAGLHVPAGWRCQVGLHEARRLAGLWLFELQMVLYTQVRAGTLARANDATCVGGTNFVRLRTPQELAEEGSIMHHCVATYAPDLATGQSFLWSLRDETGARIATLEVRMSANGRPHVAQLRARANADVPHRVWQSVQIWLGGWGEPQAASAKPDALPDARTWAHLWKPYWRTKGMGAFLPLRPPCQGLDPLLEALDHAL